MYRYEITPPHRRFVDHLARRHRVDTSDLTVTDGDGVLIVESSVELASWGPVTVTETE